MNIITHVLLDSKMVHLTQPLLFEIILYPVQTQLKHDISLIIRGVTSCDQLISSYRFYSPPFLLLCKFLPETTKQDHYNLFCVFHINWTHLLE